MGTRKVILGVALIAFLPFVSSAQGLAELNAQIEALIQQVSTIEAQIGFPAPAPLPPTAPVVTFSSSGSSSGCTVIYRTISLGASGSDVSALQSFLASQGLLSASPTGYFGALTKTALQRFQAKNNIVSSGEAWSTGYGATGPRTRALIQSLSCGSGSSYAPTPTPSYSGAAGIPCIVGNTGIPSGASVTLYDQPTSGGLCRAQARQCINGVLTGDQQFRFSSCTPATTQSDRCRLDGETLYNGESATFYSDDEVEFGESCSSIAQTRTCRNGVLSGTSRYRHASCDSGSADKCEIDGITLSHGSSRTFYNKKTVAFGTTCTSNSETRTCDDGELSGSSDYKYASCASALSNNCTLDGATVVNGASRNFYSSRTVAYGSTCASIAQSRLCSKGVFNGSDEYQYSACTVGAAGSCSLDGATVAHNQSRIFYSATSVPFGSSCSSVALSRKCNNGTLEGNTAFNKAGCTVASAGSCTLDGKTVAHNESWTFYKNSNVNFGTTCTAASNSLSRKCTNGVLSGSSDYSKSSCAIGGQPAASCTLTATPSVTIPNQNIKYSWTTKDATSGTLLGTAISSVPSGSRTVGGLSAVGERIIDLNVSGPGGSGKCSTTIKVQNSYPPTCTLRITKIGTAVANTTAATNVAKSASSITVAATATDANELTVSFDPSGPSTPLQTITSPFETTATHTLTKSGTITYTFNGPAGTCSKSVSVAFKAPTCSITGPASVKYADPVTLQWSTSADADYVTFGSTDQKPTTGSITLPNQTETKTHVFTVVGPGGQATCSKEVRVDQNLKVLTPSSGSYSKGDFVDIEWQYTGTPPTNSGVYLVLMNSAGTQVSSAPIIGLQSLTSGYAWKLPDTLGGTSISNGEYKIRAIVYSPKTACTTTSCGTHTVHARADSGTITLNTGIAGTVVQNLANALSAIETALVSIINFLTP